MDPDYLAERVCAHHGFARPLSLLEVLAVCEERGVPVRWGRFRGGGYYLRLPEPLILLDYDAGPFVAAHELYHHLSADLAEWDDDEHLAVYVFTPNGRSQQERDANRFAELLCGED